jgi:hypothetical protein
MNGPSRMDLLKSPENRRPKVFKKLGLFMIQPVSTWMTTWVNFLSSSICFTSLSKRLESDGSPFAIRSKLGHVLGEAPGAGGRRTAHHFRHSIVTRRMGFTRGPRHGVQMSSSWKERRRGKGGYCCIRWSGRLVWTTTGFNRRIFPATEDLPPHHTCPGKDSRKEATRRSLFG